MAYHAEAMPHRIEYLQLTILIMSGFISYGSSLMGSIKKLRKYKTLIFEGRGNKEFSGKFRKKKSKAKNYQDYEGVGVGCFGEMRNNFGR
jgi:hypothetical protein